MERIKLQHCNSESNLMEMDAAKIFFYIFLIIGVFLCGVTKLYRNILRMPNLILSENLETDIIVIFILFVI